VTPLDTTRHRKSSKGAFVREQHDLRTIELDVLSEESVNAAIQEIIADDGRLEVVIQKAGHMVFGPTDAFTPEQLAEHTTSMF